MRRAWACWLLVGIVALAGCGGKSGPKSNGVTDMTATQILAAMKKAVADATSVHISGSGSSSGTQLSLDLQLARDKGGTGHIVIDGYEIDLVRIGNDLYVSADAKAISHFAGSALGTLLGGKWFKVSVSSNGFGSFAPFTDLQKLMNQILTASGTVTKGDETTIDGQPALALTDSAKGGTLYVATTGPAYPLQLRQGGSKTGAISFTDWDQPVTLTAPKNALDYSKLTGG